eukprot:TRINITY_DN153_c1_g2_i1.p1 TRINITY_DN153_c1_g2~~TRINITY_DN153_c1_g2_i1.p1  ORF type:complete len:2021 (+),score=692.58 TRINITY_DN153_c1_g2_i1:98-6160(+)
MSKATQELDLSARELRNRTGTHVKLAYLKQMKVKRRKPCGFACEVLLPPLLLCALLIGWGLADTDNVPAQDFAGNGYFNVTSLVQNSFCIEGGSVKGGSIPNLGPQHTLRQCPPQNVCDASAFNMTLPKLDIGDGKATLCPLLDMHDPATLITTAQGIKKLIEFAGVYSAVDPATLGASVPSFDAMVVLQKLSKASLGSLKVQSASDWGALLHSGWVEVVSADGNCETALKVSDHLNETTAMYGLLYNETINRGACNNRAFASEDAAVKYIRGDGADLVWALVVVNQLEMDAKVLDYTIRMNYTAAPYTLGGTDKFSQGLGKKRAQQYLNAGFATLQTSLNKMLVDGEGHYAKYDFNFVTLPMPIAAYRNSQFFDQAGSLIPLCLSLAFLYPVSCLVSGIVLEKEQRLREGMLIMGLAKSAFYSSWFLTYATMMTASSLLMALVSGSTYFGHTSPVLLFLLFELYSISMVTFALLVSVFFSKAKIAAIAAPLISFVLVIPKFSLSEDIAVGEKFGISFLSPCAFAYGMDLVSSYEKQGVGSGFGDFTADDFAYASSVGMMLFDIILYLLLAFYLDLVLPSEYGVKLHPLFFAQPSWWRKKCAKGGGDAAAHGDGGHAAYRNAAPPARKADYVETGLDPASQAALAARERVRILGLSKEFKTGDRLLRAVDSFGNGLPEDAPGGGGGFPMYEGQIQCVLGHNGAGKTTLINMMTGMLPASDGDCMIWGDSIRTDVQDIRKNVGYCPQHNILWERLTVEEHLRFYGALKGIAGDELDDRITKMLQLVNLYEKRGAWSSVLSGGQKRKLSVACALIGGSRLVFLDEPTAGMDVESRRAMWDLLRNPKVLEGRVIVLTTHYMEEADLLGDSVAIMHKGCLHSWGSPFFLKSKLGVGYNLSLSVGPQCTPSEVEAVIASYLPRAGVTRVSCTGNELRVLIPQAGEPSEDIKRLAASKLGLTYESPDKLKDQASAALAAGSDAEKEAAAQVLDAIRTANGFPDLFDELDRSKKSLGVEGYGISVTTLEEVFLKIEMEGEGDTNEYALDGSPAASPASSAVRSPRDETDEATPMLTPGQRNGSDAADFGELYTIKPQGGDWQPPEGGLLLFKTQFKGLFLKRLRYGRRDKRALCFQFALPIALILFALWLGSFGPPTMPELVLDAGVKLVYDTKGEQVDLPFGTYWTEAAADFYDGAPFGNGYSTKNETAACPGADTVAGFSACLLEEYNAHDRSHPRGAAVWMPFAENRSASKWDTPMLRDTQTALFLNASSVHALPAMTNALYNAYLADATRVPEGASDAKITTRSHPLPFSDRLSAIIDAVKIVITGLFIMIPFTLIPSNFVSYVVKEREGKSKHVQVISGANLGAYWASSFLFDFLSFMVTVTLAFIVFFADDRTEFIGDAGSFFATLLLFIFFGTAAITISYAMSFMFSTYTAAQNAAMIFHFFCGFIFVITVKVLVLIDSTKDVGNVLKWVFRVIPSYCLGEGIINLSSRGVAKSIGIAQDPFDMDVAGAPLIFLVASTVVYTVLTVFIEARGLKGQALTWTEFKEIFTGASSAPASDTELSGSATAIDVDAPDTFDLPAPTDPPSVKKRRGGWLMVMDEATGAPFYFNEVDGTARWSSKDTPFYEDPSVLEHAREIIATSKGRPNDAVVVRRLRKVWARRGNMKQDKVAVRDLSFAVESGELFAFLGTNGAGKTTTLSVLSGEFPQTTGKAWIGGYDTVEQGQQAKQNLGFCPQFDACLELLTCEEHLELFAALRGIPKPRVQPSIELLLNGLGLAAHRKKLSKNLSGGNRRKLSVAIALLGGPPVVFLDEPSAGMDPIARRGLWLALENAITRLNLSVVLTTHHLEEIEGLARLNHRVTIMVDGRLQCLGSLTQLKTNFGDSYELIVKVESQADETKLAGFMRQRWPGAVLVESSQQRLTYNVPKSATTLSAMFREVENQRRRLGVADYSINETSLEQVFIRISQRALREEEAEAYAATAGAARFPIARPVDADNAGEQQPASSAPPAAAKEEEVEDVY